MMGKKPPVVPPVEELSDLQWARIERGMWNKLDAAAPAPAALPRVRGTSWRKRGLVIGGGLAAAAVLALWLGRAPSRSDAVAEVPSRVLTRDSSTTVSFADAAIEVASHSAVLLTGGADRAATVVIEGGRASFRVAPRKHPFLVVAGHATVRVVGTQFSVERRGEAVDVEVHEGKVTVQYLGQLHQVIAGARWSSSSATPVQTVLLDAPSEEITLDDEAPSKTAPAPTRTKRPKATLETAAETTEIPAEPSRPSEAPEETTAPVVEDDARAAFAAAAKLESAAPKEALRRYLELAKREGRWGANALFAAARLAFDIGQRDQAGSLARTYLRRFPAGANAADARALLDAIP